MAVEQVSAPDPDHVVTTTHVVDSPVRAMRTRPVEVCHVCGSGSRPHYDGLRDRLYDTPGVWTVVRCANADCDLWWLNPMPVAEDLGMAYASYYTHGDPPHSLPSLRYWYEGVKTGYLQVRRGYGPEIGPAWGRYVWWMMYLHPMGGAAADSNANYIDAPRDGRRRLLDVGCGSGYALARMKAYGWDVEGLEVDEAAVAHARGKGLTIRAGFLEDQDYPDGCFDVVHSAHVIEHVPDPRRLLKTCLRILSPGGRLVIRTPNTEGLGVRYFGKHTLSLDPPRHLMLFNVRNLPRLAESVGFAVERVTTPTTTAAGIYTLSREIQQREHTAIDVSRKVPGIWYQLVERAWSVFSPTIGEEVMLVARKP